MSGRVLNASRTSEPAQAPGRGDDGSSKRARALDIGDRTASARVDEMIAALLEAVHGPGTEPSEAPVDPSPPRIDARVETRRRAEPTVEPTGREFALYAVAFVALVLMAIALGIVVGILSDHLSR